MPYKTVDELKTIVTESISKAQSLSSKIPHDITYLKGFSSPKIRHLLNNLCSYGPCNYLEIGIFTGSTFIPAIFKNECKAIGIDDWSQFKKEEAGYDARETLNKNLLNFGSDLGQYEIRNQNCFDFPYELPKPNVFLYDGAHDALSTKTAIEVYGKAAHQPFVMIVDDIQLVESVWEGTRQALNSFTVHLSKELKKADGYHEGVLVMVLEAV